MQIISNFYESNYSGFNIPCTTKNWKQVYQLSVQLFKASFSQHYQCAMGKALESYEQSHSATDTAPHSHCSYSHVSIAIDYLVNSISYYYY